MKLTFLWLKPCLGIGSWVKLAQQLPHSNEEIFDPLWSRKRPPPISDHLGLTFWVVALRKARRYSILYSWLKHTSPIYDWGGRWDFRFCRSGQFLVRFFGLSTFGLSTFWCLVRFAGFLQFSPALVFGFCQQWWRFFGFFYPMHFMFFLVLPRKLHPAVALKL